MFLPGLADKWKYTVLGSFLAFTILFGTTVDPDFNGGGYGMFQADLFGADGTELEDFTLDISHVVTDNDGADDTVDFTFAAVMGEDFPGDSEVDGIAVSVIFPAVVTPSNPVQVNNSDDGEFFDEVVLVDIVGGRKRATIVISDLGLVDDGDLFDFSVDFAAFAEHTVEISAEVLTGAMNVYDLGSQDYLVDIPEEEPEPEPEPEPDPEPDPDPDPAPSGGGGGGSSRKIVSTEEKEELIVISHGGGLEHPFVDLEDHYAEDSISLLWNLGIVKGYDGNLFKPDQGATRAEVSKMVLMALEYELMYGDHKVFPDVDLGKWYSNIIYTGYVYEVLNGYGDGLFRPEQKVSRAEALKIVLLAGEMPISKYPKSSFPDVESFGWYKDIIQTAYSYSIVNGYHDGRFGPNDPITRGQIAIMIVNLFYEDLGILQEYVSLDNE